MANREFLMLAQKYGTEKGCKKPFLGGWLMSEKLDGMRAFWDGGVSRRLIAEAIPWANTAKDKRLTRTQVATGLWSRYGKVIHAPDWWLDKLPNAVLDGELWAGHGQFQSVMTIAKHMDGSTSDEWSKIKFMAFDMPNVNIIFSEGKISNPNFNMKMDVNLCMETFNKILTAKNIPKPDMCGTTAIFESRVFAMRTRLTETDVFKIHSQTQLPLGGDVEKAVNEALDIVLKSGGEGLILRDNMSYYEVKRSNSCLKYKPYLDDEATVLGYVWGRETDKGSKLLGLMGAMIVEWQGKRFELSGFTDAERAMDSKFKYDPDHGHMFVKDAGKQCTDMWTNPKFPINSKVTFRYRELSNDGIPKEARFLRKKVDE